MAAIDAVPPDYTTPCGQVRLLIPDTAQLIDVRDPNSKSYMLSDDQINALLALNLDSVRRAAADACEIIGTDDLLIGKVITQTDFATDASKVSAQMLARAESLRDQATLAGETGVADVDGLVLSPGVPICFGPPELVAPPWYQPPYYTGVD